MSQAEGRTIDKLCPSASHRIGKSPTVYEFGVRNTISPVPMDVGGDTDTVRGL